MVTTTTQCKTRCENTQELGQCRFITGNGACSGFLVLEVIVALMILSVASLLVAWYQAHTCLLYNEAMRETQALSHARNLIARIEQGREPQLSGLSVKETITLAWRHEPFNGLSRGALVRKGLEGKKLPVFANVTVAASWHTHDGQQRTLTLARVVRLPDKKGGA